MKATIPSLLIFTASLLSGCSPHAVAAESKQTPKTSGDVPSELLVAAVKVAGSSKNSVPILALAEANYFTRKVADEVWHCYRFTVTRDVKNRFDYFTEMDVNLQFVRRGTDWYRKTGDVGPTEPAKAFKAQLIKLRQTISEGIAAKVIEQDSQGAIAVFNLFASEARRFKFSPEEIRVIDAAVLQKANWKIDALSGAAQRAQGVDRAKDEANFKAVRESVKCLDMIQQRIDEFEAAFARN